ncbi:cytochrome c family protein [Parasphingorhabdus sp. JC815]|uniref:c-type cytochrome n=1 Tax=Parasphingorhabdus sp. JC815 TaxID=3232140 RepID=UPI0034592353
MTVKITLISAATLLLLSACGSETDSTPQENNNVAEAVNTDESTESAETMKSVETAAAPPAGFAQCRTCHTVEKDGRDGIGPNLWGVAGHPAAQQAGFAYSPAMRSSGLTWDSATLDKFLKEPLKIVRGTKMAYAGLRNDKQRAEVIAYLETLKD